ncbi:MAG: class I SAM-dependent methyltransferase [Jatrophihabitans sp.]|uniref:class I SAM-dependent methyltransferase n=1 Tax=Jatrophihabitans sp. TaxID=1932789 RepID=UPI003F814FB8
MFTDSSAYERFMGRWSRRLAPLVVDFAGAQDGETLLDVGCGTGSLTSALVEANPSGRVLGVDPSEDFVRLATERVPAADIRVGDAMALPVPDGTVDRAIAALVINFVPSPAGALAEMARVVRPDGVVAAALWDYDGGMQMLTHLWDAVRELFGDARPAASEHAVLCHRGRLAELWRAGGLVDVDERPLEFGCPFESFDDFWEPFLLRVGPPGTYIAALSDAGRDRLRAALHDRLGDGPFELTARALAVRGVRR